MAIIGRRKKPEKFPENDGSTSEEIPIETTVSGESILSSLPAISIRNPVFAWMLMASLVLFGGISVSRMGLSQLPDVDFPVLNINISLAGAPPEVMETDIADIVEDSVMSVEGIRQVNSTARQGSVDITLELNIDQDVDSALQEVQARLAQIQRRLPPQIDAPIITKQNPEDIPIIYVAITTDRPLPELMMYVRNTLKDYFQVIPGVGAINFGGYVDRNVRIWLDAGKMSYYQITTDDILNTLSQQHIEVPAGRLSDSRTETNLRSMGEVPTVQAFRDVVIPSRAGGGPMYGMVHLNQVARIEDGTDDVRRISRFNGRLAVGLGIQKQRGSNAVEVARAVKGKLEEIRKILPPGYAIDVANDATRSIEDAVHELEFNLILSAVLTGFVCWLFLGSFRSTLNILLAIPTSILGTFIFLYFAGYTLNTFTLLALTLVIGIVVDDAIMVLENITRHREKGEDRITGALNGSREITSAAVATSLSLIAIFLPVTFMQGIIGRYFLQFGIAVSVAVILSLLEALTLTPSRCAQFLEAGQGGRFEMIVDRIFKAASRLYLRILVSALQHRGRLLIVSTIVFTASLFIFPFLRKEFIPAQDQSRLLVRFQTTAGSSIEFTDSQAKKLEAFLSTKGEVLRYFTIVGGFGGSDVNSGGIFITMKDKDKRPEDPEKKRPLSQAEFAQIVRASAPKIVPGLKVVVQDLSLRGFATGRGFPVEMTISGADWKELASMSRKIMSAMEKTGYFTDIDSNYLEGVPELQIVPNRAAAAELGVTMSNLGSTLGVLMAGQRAGRFKQGGHSYDIRVMMETEQKIHPENLLKLYVRNLFGGMVPVSSLVRMEKRSSILSITRSNRQRSITIYANPAVKYGLNASLEKGLEIARSSLPAGYAVELSGAAKSSSESFQGLLMALFLGIIVAYMILASQYNSYLHPALILLALPFSLTGALAALFLTGQTVNMYSMIGIILLMGLVKKNSILLVDFTNQMRRLGMAVDEALLSACPIRLRPILMTTLSAVAAALPAALSVGPGSEARIPMAVVVIGGLILSTLVTLFLVPCAYSLTSRR